MGQNAFNVDPEKSVIYQTQSLSCMLSSHDLFNSAKIQQEQLARARDSVVLVARYMFISATRFLVAQRSDLIDVIFRYFSAQAKSRQFKFDLIDEPICECMKIISAPRSQDQIVRFRAFAYRFQSLTNTKGGIAFADESVRTKILRSISDCIKKLEQ